MTALRDALSESALRRALLAFLAFAITEEGVWLGILLYAYDVGGSAAVGAIAVAQLVPAMLLVPFMTVLVDRLSVRAGLAFAYAISAAATLVVGLLLLVDAPVWTVVMAAVVQSIAVTLGRPAHYAALPKLAELPSHLVAGNAVTGTIDALGVLLGPLSVAIVLSISGVAPLFVVLAALLALGAALIATAKVHPAGIAGEGPAGAAEAGVVEVEQSPAEASSDEARPAEADEPEPFLRAATLGVREVRRIPGAFRLLVIIGLAWVLQGALDVLGVAFAVEILEAGDQGASVFAAGNGLGLLIGAVVAVLLVGVARLSRVLVGGAVICGLALAAVGLTDTLAVALVLVVVSGVARSLMDVAGRTLLHRNADDRAMARVFGVQEAVLLGGLALGAAAAPLAIAAVGERAAFALAGAALTVPALFAVSSLAALDRTGVLAAARIGLLRRLALFSPLAPPDMERLALASDRCPAVEGERLIEQGAAGDCFYAIESGSYAVVRDGERVAVLTTGDFFGEIALLRDVPRTASVVCVEPGMLLVLEREPFLRAMSRARPPREPD